MKATIEILENHCWNGGKDSSGVRLANDAKTKGQKTIPLSELNPDAEPRRSIIEHFTELNQPECLQGAEIVRIYGMDYDGEDEVRYMVDLAIPDPVTA